MIYTFCFPTFEAYRWHSYYVNKFLLFCTHSFLLTHRLTLYVLPSSIYFLFWVNVMFLISLLNSLFFDFLLNWITRFQWMACIICMCTQIYYSIWLYHSHKHDLLFIYILQFKINLSNVKENSKLYLNKFMYVNHIAITNMKHIFCKCRN